MLFPFVVAMLYAAATYGIVFFSQYRMQNAVDRAVSTALYVDRSAFEASELKGKVEGKANATLSVLVKALPAPLSGIDATTACAVEPKEADVELLRCRLSYGYKAEPIVPVMSFGMLGSFPPLPAVLEAEARTAF